MLTPDLIIFNEYELLYFSFSERYQFSGNLEWVSEQTYLVFYDILIILDALLLWVEMLSQIVMRTMITANAADAAVW